MQVTFPFAIRLEPRWRGVADSVSQTRPADSDFDGVSIVATSNKSTGPELVLLKQYRPALDKVVIEIPGGLIDPGETAEQCAVRELKEETGFVGEVERVSRTLFNCEYITWRISL